MIFSDLSMRLNYKKMVALVLTGLMVFSMVACDDVDEVPDVTTVAVNITETAVEETTPTTTEAKKLNIGDVVTLGCYQNVDMKWLVIASEDDRYLVVSTNKIDTAAYNIEDEEVNWEICSIREWLNDEFYNGAFAVSERENIKMHIVPAAKSGNKRIKIGSDTEDYVFLLSEEEFRTYLQPITSGHELETCRFMLRTPGPKGNTIVYVEDFDTVADEVAVDNTVNMDFDLVPAMWIKAF